MVRFAAVLAVFSFFGSRVGRDVVEPRFMGRVRRKRARGRFCHSVVVWSGPYTEFLGQSR